MQIRASFQVPALNVRALVCSVHLLWGALPVVVVVCSSPQYHSPSTTHPVHCWPPGDGAARQAVAAGAPAALGPALSGSVHVDVCLPGAAGPAVAPPSGNSPQISLSPECGTIGIERCHCTPPPRGNGVSLSIDTQSVQPGPVPDPLAGGPRRWPHWTRSSMGLPPESLLTSSAACFHVTRPFHLIVASGWSAAQRLPQTLITAQIA